MEVLLHAFFDLDTRWKWVDSFMLMHSQFAPSPQYLTNVEYLISGSSVMLMYGDDTQ
jgi:hypothetical protein